MRLTVQVRREGVCGRRRADQREPSKGNDVEGEGDAGEVGGGH